MTISLDKQYRTRDGREVKLLMVDGGGEYPIIGAILEREKTWSSECWRRDGIYNLLPGSSCDLIEVKPRIKLEQWVNMYRTSDGRAYTSLLYSTPDVAKHRRDSDAIACVKITIDCEEGEGL